MDWHHRRRPSTDNIDTVLKPYMARKKHLHGSEYYIATMAESYPIGTRAESERLVRDWGFDHVFTWSDGG